MQIKLMAIAAIMLLGAVCKVQADEEVAPRTFVTASNYGECYFRMVPDADGGLLNHEKGAGAAFRVRPDGKDEMLWTTSGWYSDRVFLSDDCRHLVRLGPWPRGQEPSDKHLAVGFYENGKLLKSYSTKELIKDVTKITPSVSHYQFLSAAPRLSDTELNIFTLTTIDGIEYKFNISNGSIVHHARPPS